MEARSTPRLTGFTEMSGTRPVMGGWMPNDRGVDRTASE